MRTGVLVFGLAMSLVLGLMGTSTAADTDGCDLRTTSALRVGDLYFTSVTASTGGVYTEVFQEGNGVDGLQRRSTACEDGSIIPADSCLYGYAAYCSPLSAAP